jgi:hypothetical protein
MVHRVTDGVLAAILERFDAWVTRQRSTIRNGLSRGATATQLERVSKSLGVPLPRDLKALYAWRDGETETGELFDEVVRPQLEETWASYNDDPLEVRFMPLTEVVRAGAFRARLDDDTGECRQTVTDPDKANCHLVPFLWIRSPIGEDATEEDEDGDEVRVPAENDWHLAVDTERQSVWLFEVSGEGLAEVVEASGTLAEWLSPIVSGLERGEIPLDGITPSERIPRVEPAARLLLRFLIDREQIELAEGVPLDAVAAKLGPLLDKKPRRSAIDAVVEFFEDDEAIAELYADDDLLREVVGEFVE